MSNGEIFVTDASPLITLARAGALDLLLHLKMTIEIPDAVYVEATNNAHGDGRAIVAWINANRKHVNIVPTNIGVSQVFLLSNGQSARNFGEFAALEAIDRFFLESPQGLAILLYEDADVQRRRPTLDERLTLITTGTFLAELEHAGLIQSADRILDEAAATGRNIERQRDASGDPILRSALAPSTELP